MVTKKGNKMQENNEVMKDSPNAEGSSAGRRPSGGVGALSAKKNTKKLNAGIAIIALQNIHQQSGHDVVASLQGGLSEEQLLEVMNLSERLTKTALYIHGGEDQAGIRQCINLIEDYLKEQGV